MNSLLRSLLSLLILPPSVLGPSFTPVRKEVPMWTLAECGRKQSRQLSLALSVGAAGAVESLVEPTQLLQALPDKVCHIVAGSVLQPLQIFEVSASPADGANSVDLLHGAQASLQGCGPSIDVRGHANGHTAFVCHINDIQESAENSASVTGVRRASRAQNSGTSSECSKVPALLDRILRDKGRTLQELEALTLAEVEKLRREESTEFLSARVLLRLQTREAKEPEDSYKTTYNLAWRIVWHCHRRDAVECSPVTLSYYEVVGCHEDQFYDRLMIRRAAMFGDGNRISISARKKRGKAEPAGADKRATPPSPKKSAPVPRIKKGVSA